MPRLDARWRHIRRVRLEDQRINGQPGDGIPGLSGSLMGNDTTNTDVYEDT